MAEKAKQLLHKSPARKADAKKLMAELGRGGPGPRVRNVQSINAASSCRFPVNFKIFLLKTVPQMEL
jgi:hypothetical protein